MSIDLTTDSIWNNQISILQSRSGYRFGIDAVLLSHFIARENDAERALEIGTGNGIIPVLLSHLSPFKMIVALEIQKDLASLARENMRRNSIGNTHIVRADAKHASRIFRQAHVFDLLYSNPPYRQTGRGKLNPLEEKAVARHEIKLTMEDLFECALKTLKPGGRMTTIYPAFRESDYRNLVARFSLHIHELRYVHSFAHEPPAFFLATVKKHSGPVKEHSPLAIYESPGKYTEETAALLTEPVK